MSRDKHCALRLMLVLVFAAISLPVVQDALPVPPTATAVRQHKAFVDGVNEMSVKMYRATAKDPHQTGDAVLSPLSVTILASMLSAGTSDVVEQRACQQIAPGLSASELHAKIKGYFASVRERRGINGDLAIANSLWSDSSLELRKPYADFARGQYGAELHAADFRGAPDTALAQINQWVKHQTKGAIPRLLKRSQISERTKLIGVNAVYLSRNWMIPFDEQLTKSEDFCADWGGEDVDDGTQSDDSLFQGCGRRSPHALVSRRKRCDFHLAEREVDLE